jgi:hypothetical protein
LLALGILIWAIIGIATSPSYSTPATTQLDVIAEPSPPPRRRVYYEDEPAPVLRGRVRVLPTVPTLEV